MMDISDLFLCIRARHGHYCPMSTLGGRLGLAALSILGDRGEELMATYHIDTCAADGIAVATGCLQEDGRLVVRNDGRHRLELRGSDGRGAVAELTAAALAQAAACRRRLDAGEDADVVLTGLRAAPVADLIVLTPLAGEENDA
jgi:formylmethanofuran dehydrogenase subunit E